MEWSLYSLSLDKPLGKPDAGVSFETIALLYLNKEVDEMRSQAIPRPG